MDSINAQQPEQNRKDLSGSEAAATIKKLVDKAGSCFFCTRLGKPEGFSTRPMSVQKIDDDATCWFLSASDSHKNADIAEDPRVQILLQGSPHSDFLSMMGKVSITTDKAIIDELWQPILKTWFTEGKDDPRITVLKFEPSEGYYWDTKHGTTVAFVKQLIGAAMGKTLDDSIEGDLKV